MKANRLLSMSKEAGITIEDIATRSGICVSTTRNCVHVLVKMMDDLDWKISKPL